MSVVMLRVADGRRALLAFTGPGLVADLARRCPAGAGDPGPAAQTARAEGAAAVLIDVAGPVPAGHRR